MTPFTRYLFLTFFLAASISACALPKKGSLKAESEPSAAASDEAIETFVDVAKPPLTPSASKPAEEKLARPEEAVAEQIQVALEQIESLKKKVEELDKKVETLSASQQEKDQAFNTFETQQQQIAQKTNQLEEQVLLLPRQIEELEEKYSKQVNYKLSKEALEENMIYEKAQKLYRAGNYVDAVIMFKKHVSSFPQSTLADNAQYWIGEGYYSQGDYNRALEEFEKVSTFPDKSKVPDALLREGYCYQQLGNYPKAREIFSQVIDTYANDQAEYAVVDSARRKLREIKGK